MNNCPTTVERSGSDFFSDDDKEQAAALMAEALKQKRKDRNWKDKIAPAASFALLLFGVLLPTATLVIELVTHMCAGSFFDPLPTWFHVLLVAAVPVANLLAWLNIRETSPHVLRVAWLANGVAFGVSLFYAILYLPMAPFAAIGIVILGLGLLPLSPLLSFICTVRLRVRIRRQLTHCSQPVPRGWWWSAMISLLLLLLMAVPGPLTRHWIDLTESSSVEESTRAIKLLRTFGSEDSLLKECYGRTDRLWVEFSGRRPDTEVARKVFYRVTGKPFNAVPPPLSKYQQAGRDVFDEFDWDAGLGGEAVAGKVKGLSVTASRMDGICKPEEGWAYVEWILEFRNDHQSAQREARAQIQLPPGGVVSRLTLWVNGEEREAAFAGRGEVREAYQKVAVQQRRDPVLVTTSGPDRVLMQCFPVQPGGGLMKVRVGITAPLALADEKRAALRPPYLVERNFRMPESFQHSLWLESSQPASAGSKQFRSDLSDSGKAGIRGQIADSDLSSQDGVVWFNYSSDWKQTYAVDQKSSEANLIKQVVQPVSRKVPNRVAIVLDGSKSMTEFFPQIARALGGMPSQSELSIWLVQDGVQNIFDGPSQASKTPQAAISGLKGVGGQDNIPGLIQAWEWAAAKPNSAVLWIHGSQPALLNSIESLKQRLERANESPVILDVPTTAGPNHIAEQLSTTSGIKALQRFGTLREDLGRLFAIWSQRKSDFHFIRTLEREPAAAGNTASGSSHIVRLWAADEIQRLLGARRISDAVKLAGIYQLVTPVSGAVVLETKQQFQEAGLTPVDPATVPSVPEPSTWALMAIGSIILLFRKRLKATLLTSRHA